MAVTKREIYSIGYDVVVDGQTRKHGYTLGVPSFFNQLRVPVEIKLETIRGQEYVTVVFTDRTKHKIPFSGIEIMDRVVEPKTKESGQPTN
jgi:hypothetical protein